MRKSIEERLYEFSKSRPDKPAIITFNEETITYKALWEAVIGFSCFLKLKGIQKGDIVVIRASQTIRYSTAYFAIHLVGAVVVSLEKTVPVKEMDKVASKLGARLIIDHLVHDIETIAWVDPSTITIEKNNSIDDKSFQFGMPDDTADILYTTGTTGSSKGVELSNDALAATAENIIDGCGYKENTVLILPGPLNHANAIRKLFTTIYNGSTIYLLDGMTLLSNFYKALDYESDSIACCLPPASIRMIFTLSGDTIGKYSDKIDFIESATSPLPEPDKEHLSRLLPKTRLINNYGSSESASVCMYDYNSNPGLNSCVGKPTVNSKIIIVDDDNNPIVSSKDLTGRIACQGDMNMKGYFGEPELTADVLKNGIVFTNDIGYMDSDGFVYVIGRDSDVINVGGLKVAPAEVEEVALAYEGIVDCICIPIENSISGKTPVLLVVMENGTTLDSRGLKTFMQENLEAYKVPVKYKQVENINRTYNGKLDRKSYKDFSF